MPRYLSTEQVDRLIAACDGDAGVRRRGVCGKSRYEVRLPLPQDVGDAIAAYLECRPSTRRNDVLFLRMIAPCRPFRRGDGLSSVVKRIMKRADIVPPVKGAHALRHTAATEMLRHGVPLDKIGLVLRHRGIDTTAYYAKGRRRAAEAGCSALAGGALMLDAIETYRHANNCDGSSP
ncbi:tyrosine-type recombinase/integrase [Bradyrhizobium cosmicum]|uniref:tyrosine-type recombinase/integrase n=1 Tax=Bradyrhizobium cosmicum TaxID=1404864 RepID=UPI0028E73777|nr:tyrosine-type recombinase/integrase [Bradyrhizobium cosmicum]